jgi:optic atrophy 3 protein
MALYVKAFALVLKTISKPMSKSLKSFIVSQPELKKRCISLAQKINVMYSFIVLEAPIPKSTAQAGNVASGSSHATGVNIVSRGRQRSGSSSSSQPRIVPLTDEQALTNGAELVSEIFLFSVAGALVWWEAEKSNEREEKKKVAASLERQQLTKLMEITKESLEDIVAEIEELRQWQREVSEMNRKLILVNDGDDDGDIKKKNKS